ncbi:ead/Ea22-like family protein [Enterobacter mori]|uniref:Ead/Ea22-like family protein n=1 Tax=Enterobacter mori TaxID=539813 RepID=A0A9Q7K1R9_9ENTR|nr:ead/Ea22-like family protein [Enterobacter mori]MCC8229804.1 ead/Ea22-like family protein [Enterobacter mori]MCC8239350.1 ead/Ea22-like family protein [Enterobacter mori]RTQ23313.1 ead/Ea22-like family protein [Enterobacter mori]
MSNIDKQALREAAEKATSGKWERGDGNGNGGELLVYCDDALGSAICEMTSEYNAIPKYQRINNLNFIAAANPATVLALLDEIADLEQGHCGAALLEREESHAKTVGKLLDELEAKDKRIAELEAREVVLPSVQDVHPLGPQSAKIFCEFHRSIVNRCADEIRKVGVKVSIKGA